MYTRFIRVVWVSVDSKVREEEKREEDKKKLEKSAWKQPKKKNKVENYEGSKAKPVYPTAWRQSCLIPLLHCLSQRNPRYIESDVKDPEDKSPRLFPVFPPFVISYQWPNDKNINTMRPPFALTVHLHYTHDYDVSRILLCSSSIAGGHVTCAMLSKPQYCVQDTV